MCDDSARSFLISRRNSDLVNMIKTCRHNHSTVILAAQTITDSILDLKRVATDIVIWRNVSHRDLEKLITDVSIPHQDAPAGMTVRQYMLNLHSKLPDKRYKIIIHLVGNRILVEN